MSNPNSLAATVLATSAPAYASLSASQLMERRPELQQRFGEAAFGQWTEHFRQRVMELSAALAENEPKLFSARVLWSQDAFEAREISGDLLTDSLECLRDTLSSELPDISQAGPLEYIRLALSSLDHPVDTAPASSGDSLTNLAQMYLVRVLEGNAHQAIRLVVESVEQGEISRIDAYEQVLLAAQREAGTMWHRGEISVAEEHLATTATMQTMAVLAYRAERAEANGLTVVSAAVARNIHDIGIRAVTDFFEFAGWRTICLGRDAPAGEIAEAVCSFEARLLLVSAALTTQLAAVRESIAAVRQTAPDCRIMVGGTAFADAPEIWKAMGADGHARGLADAVATGTRLVQSASSRPD